MNQLTTEKLAAALREANAPDWMVSRARQGYYDDYKSDLADPIGTLVADLRGQELESLAQKAIDGEFDGTPEESAAWFAKEGGYLLMHELGMPSQKRPKAKGFG